MAKRETSRGAKDSPDHMVRGTRPTRRELIDCMALCSCLALLISSTLLLANGTCSHPHGLSADFPVCVGGQLSVQAWLAIIGIEFSLTGSVLLPRLLSTAISKSLTSKLLEKGVLLDKLLNSLSTAPFLTQLLKGWKKIALLRIAVVLVAIPVTVLYKFSFVQVKRQDTVLVHADWIEMGSSPAVPGVFCKITDSWSGDDSIFNNNYRDLVSGGNNSILYQGNWTANAISGPATLLIGPGINATSVPQMRSGLVRRCVPAAYTAFTISTAPGPSTWSKAIAPFANGVQLGAPQYPDAGYIKIARSSDGLLKFLPVNNGTFKDSGPEYGLNFEFVVTVQIQDCWGNFTWNNAQGYQVFQIQEPVDTFCNPRNMTYFDSDFQNTANFAYSKAIIGAYFSGRSFYTKYDYAVSWDIKRAIELFLLGLPIQQAPSLPAPGSMALTNPGLKALCDTHATSYNDDGRCLYAPSEVAVLDGILDSHGTGMTVLGMALQCFVLLLALGTLVYVLRSGLPILTEWPAQWLALAVGLPPMDVAATVAGTSMGKNRARGSNEVFLASVSSEDKVYLRLTSRRGELFRGAEHM
ncbi:hypothetical protein B0J13DRAFT_624853 [Dactylonectria estremocensis]|uniref:Uncharacterized protein n=1 Tax=Dactylonectria estremocensis TaxID=1079267 RepID=A0A9P9EN05_9HYPO|nr:hypothetical protein B0J13DRAFT_624853 [Dactylonectria estremocensis]